LKTNCDSDIQLCQKRCYELSLALLASGLQRFRNTFPDTVANCLQCLDADRKATQLLEFTAEIQKIVNHVLLPRVQLPKLVGKDEAKKIDDIYTELKSFFTELAAIMPWFITADEQIEDPGLFVDATVNFLARLFAVTPVPADTGDAAADVATSGATPTTQVRAERLWAMHGIIELMPGLDVVKNKLSDISCSYACRALVTEATTCGAFMKELIAMTDIAAAHTIFAERFVGNINPADVERRFDYCRIYSVYLQGGTHVLSVPVENTTIDMQACEVCVAGILFPIVRFVVHLQSTLTGVIGAAGTMEQAKLKIADASLKIVTKTAVAGAAVNSNVIKSFIRAVHRAAAILAAGDLHFTEVMKAVLDYAKKGITEHISELVSNCKADLNAALDDLQRCCNLGAFASLSIDVAHDHPFSNDEKSKIKLASESDDGKYIYAIVSKVETDVKLLTTVLDEITRIVAKTGPIPDHDICEKLADVSAWLANTLADNSSEQRLARGGALLGFLTAFQALLRPLHPGENRQTLAHKCLSGLQKRAVLRLHPGMYKKLQVAAGA
jgi:hypothetical protein